MKITINRSILKQYLLITLATVCLLFIIIGIILWVQDPSWDNLVEFLPQIIFSLIKKPLFWLVVSTPFLLLSLIRYNIRRFKSKGVRAGLTSLAKTVLAPSAFLFILVIAIRWYTTAEVLHFTPDPLVLNPNAQTNQYSMQDGKLRAVHLFGIRNVTADTWKELIAANIEQLIIVPFAYQEDIDTPEIKSSIFDRNRLRSRDSVIVNLRDKAERYGIQLIIKPHLWINNPSGGKWRGDLAMNSEEEWLIWEDRYRKYILHYAQLCEQINSPVFCIGNEFYESTTHRTAFWEDLILKVRAVYTGKITYGANWDREVEAITFWDQLDYIGIQAYYPLTGSDEPEKEEIKQGWQKHLDTIEKISQQYNKPVIFTELGYKSTVDAARIPWEWESRTGDFFKKISWSTQRKCYEVFFSTVWEKSWFKGAWLWQWRGESPNTVNPANRTFSTRKKPAYEAIARGFGTVIK